MRLKLLALSLGAALLASGLATAQEKKNAPGISDTEIKIGQTMPYSGPASSYGAVGHTQAAYFTMLNEKGGINGRKINLISLDDAYSPPKTVEQTRKLVEQEGVAFIFGNVGTPTNTAIHKYLNSRKVPHLLIQTGAEKWNDPKNYPWTTAFYASYHMEANIYARYLLQNKPDAKIAVLYQNDDFGKDYLAGFKEGLGEKAKTMIVAETSYEVTDPTVDSQIVSLKASGADTFMNITTPKFAAQAIRKVADIGWKPLHLLVAVASSVGAVLEPAGLDKSVGLISAVASKTPLDDAWANDQDMKDYIAFMEKYLPNLKISDQSAVAGYISAIMMARILEQCGDDLSRENILKQATSIKETSLPMLLPGVTVKTTPDNYNAHQSLRLQRFDGKSWIVFGEAIRG